MRTIGAIRSGYHRGADSRLEGYDAWKGDSKGRIDPGNERLHRAGISGDTILSIGDDSIRIEQCRKLIGISIGKETGVVQSIADADRPGRMIVRR